MDPHPFDDLTRALATTASRRQFLKTLAGGAAGGLLAFLSIGEAAADPCKRNGKPCKKHSQCCSGNCANGTCAAPPLAQTLFRCRCNDGTTQSTCNSDECSGVTLNVVCNEVCASHGGFFAGTCDSNAC